MQPLDVVCFQPYKHYHSEAIDWSIQTGCDDFNKVEFLSVIDRIRRQTFKQETVIHAFQKTGLWPINPTPVLRRLEAIQARNNPWAASTSTPALRVPSPQLGAPPMSPNTATRTLFPPLPENNLYWVPRGTVTRQLSPQSDQETPTPTSIRGLLRAKAKLDADFITDLIEDPQASRRFQQYLRASIALGMEGQLMCQRLEETKAAENQRAVRKKRPRSYLQKGGILRADHARLMARDAVAKKEQATLESLQRKEARAQKKKEKETANIAKAAQREAKAAAREAQSQQTTQSSHQQSLYPLRIQQTLQQWTWHPYTPPNTQ